MEYKVSGGDIILYEPDLVLDDVLDTGQSFRWYKLENGGYSGKSLDTELEISGERGEFKLKNTSEETFLTVWADYFDLNTDYSALRDFYSTDSALSEACKFSKGVRLLRQDSWEALVSFIFSSNNNITRIKGIVARLAEHYGHFPTTDEISHETEESLSYLRSGFRAKYLLDAAKKVSEGEISLEKIRGMNYEAARDELMKIKGVGPKVADCVLLSGFYKTEAFPIDVWMRRALESFYPGGFPERFYSTRGIAQLYLFNYIRKHKEEKAADRGRV